MNQHLICNAQLVNEGIQIEAHVLINGAFIEKIIPVVEQQILGQTFIENIPKINAHNKVLIPGLIDDQVHFREPGLTHKGDLYTESRAAVAGGITTFMEMPNTNPQTVNLFELEHKFELASQKSIANYSFYFGATNENAHLLSALDAKHVCGIKVFMGASTGNMLVDNQEALEQIFKAAKILVATHCEDESIIRANILKYKEQYGEAIPFEMHPVIRSREACVASTKKAIALALKHNTRLHVLHISTADELALFQKNKKVEEKQITAEACIHHLFFTDADYAEKQQWIKWNPAIKTKKDREAIFHGLLDGTIDVIATDHAPHTIEEKSKGYDLCPSGGPLVQHALLTMLDFYEKGDISLERIVELMCHNPAKRFEVQKRGFIKEGYYADLVLIDLNKPYTVKKSNLLYQCGWSPFEHYTYLNSIETTFVNGTIVYDRGRIIDGSIGMPLIFNR